jgi:hypothetical protein
MEGACLRLVVNPQQPTTLLAVFLLLLVAAAVAPPHVLAADHVVGGSIWSIPPRPGLYRAWADNRTFVAGDNLGEHTTYAHPKCPIITSIYSIILVDG